jgi:uncharacterized membrane protein (UPF0127 family)
LLEPIAIRGRARRRNHPPAAMRPVARSVIGRVLASGLALLFVPIVAGAGTDRLAEMPWVCITVAGESHAVRLADTGRLRAAGFQHVPEDATAGEAIWFAYERPQRPSFHMRNVSVPLSLAWIAPDHRVLEVIRMEPESSGHRPNAPVQAVLELAPGHPLLGLVEAGVRIAPPRQRADPGARPDC